MFARQANECFFPRACCSPGLRLFSPYERSTSNAVLGRYMCTLFYFQRCIYRIRIYTVRQPERLNAGNTFCFANGTRVFPCCALFSHYFYCYYYFLFSSTGLVVVLLGLLELPARNPYRVNREFPTLHENGVLTHLSSHTFACSCMFVLLTSTPAIACLKFEFLCSYVPPTSQVRVPCFHGLITVLFRFVSQRSCRVLFPDVVL